MNRLFSVIVPIYNRPVEMKELLESLCKQTYTNFEVLVIEDGSTEKCEDIVKTFEDKLSVSYFYKTNSGQGFSRNYGFERAKGDYLIVFDSDCLIPETYFQVVNDSLNENYLDAYGGPDAAHESFTPIQKAISYSMTSLLTTGGIRGNKKYVGQFHPRGFNMGVSKKVFEETQGYKMTNKGEDIEYSTRMILNGFSVGLIEEAHVYHKRRTDFKQFYKQLFSFGETRIIIFKLFKQKLKLVHFFPMFFTLFIACIPLSWFIDRRLFFLLLGVLELFLVLNVIDSTIRNKNIKVGLLSAISSFIQLFAYGVGFIKQGWIYLRKG